MRRVIGSTFVTLDGVISSPEVWGPPYWDEEHQAYAAGLLDGVDALLLGRETFDGFAQAWPHMAGDPYADTLNAMPKYVASRTRPEGELPWNGRWLEGSVTESVAELKQQPGGTLLKFGTGGVDEELLGAGLLDELHLWVFPAVAGSGERLLDGVGTTHLELAGTSTFASGIVVLRLVPRAE